MPEKSIIITYRKLYCAVEQVCVLLLACQCLCLLMSLLIVRNDPQFRLGYGRASPCPANYQLGIKVSIRVYYYLAKRKIYSEHTLCRSSLWSANVMKSPYRTVYES